VQAIASVCLYVFACVGNLLSIWKSMKSLGFSTERCHDGDHAAVELLIFQGQPDWPMPILLREPQMVQTKNRRSRS